MTYNNMMLRHYIAETFVTKQFIAFTATETLLGIFNTKRAALKAAKKHFDSLDFNEIFQTAEALGI